MPDPNNLKAALESLLAGTASRDDRSAVLSALVSGVMVTGERAVTIGGNASDVIVITGDRNIVLSFEGVDAQAIQEILNSIAPMRLHELPSPPRDFTGRADELAELSEKLVLGGITISGLYGLGGIGKTALALKLADRIKSQYPDAQFYLDLKGTSQDSLTVAEAMAHVILAYHPTAKPPDSEAELYGLYRSVLQDQRALLLMDNAASAEQVEPLIPPEGSVLLVTSRRHFTLPGQSARNLEALSPKDAHALLRVIAPRTGEFAEEIAELCGYLPLALRLAGSALVRFVNITPQDYIVRLRAGIGRLELIETSLSLSYQLLSEDLQKWWRLLAIFPATFDEAAAAAVWNLKEEEAQNILGELIATSLVEWNETSRRYRLHDLLRLFAKSRLETEEEAEAQRLHAMHYKTTLAAANDFYLNGGGGITRGLTLLDREWGNIQIGQAWAASNSLYDDRALELTEDYASCGYLLLPLRQHPRTRISWLETALVAAKKLGRDQAAHVGNLGIAYAALSETRRALNFFEQSLTLMREDGNRRGEGAALGNLGAAYLALGEIKKAIEYLTQYLLIAREIGDRHCESHALSNLGYGYAALGEPRRAIVFHERSLLIGRENGDRRTEGTALGNLGAVYATLGEDRRAVEFYKEALLISREMGDRHAEETHLRNLGNAHLALGETTPATAFYEQSLIIANEIGDHRGEGEALHDLASAYLTMRDLKRAIEFYQPAVAIAKEIGDRRLEARALGNLGLALATIGETKQAIEVYKRALHINRETGNQRGEGYALFNLSWGHVDLGEYDQAIPCAMEALTIFELIEDPNAKKVRELLSEWQRKEH